MRLQGKIAVVTGAGSGFGAGIARYFAAEGGRVVLADLNGEAAEEVEAAVILVTHHATMARHWARDVLDLGRHADRAITA